MWILWLVVAGIMILIEIFTVTFYFAWFAVAAVVTAGVAAIWPDAIWLQLLVAAIISLVLGILTPRLTKKFQDKSPGYMADKTDVVGKEGVVMVRIEPNRAGIVRIPGYGEWTAKSEVLIGEQVPVVIERIDGLTVTVRQK